ncbi:ABC transporter permease [Neoactinobaculum massilliense]|uniref:ABC transporter permease n=1 Tax=Neoactinobaculum massilliense TaxID=2364794 RepID=UPI000F51CC1E|nr:ABC transporter permease [Neoactinobaculum massilliense]
MRNDNSQQPESAAEATVTAQRVGLSKFQLYSRRFFRNIPADIGLAVFVILALMAAFGRFLTPWSYDEMDVLSFSQAPSATHWFGTDGAGFDIFAQTVHGLGRSMIIGIVVSVCTIAIAAIIGCLAAYLGGRWESAILSVIHFLLIIPSFLLTALIVGSSKGDWKMLMLVLTLTGWMYSARVIWSMAISVREREYVMAARFMGVGGLRTVVRHIVPNIGSLLIINATLGVISAIMSETGLSFLGLGVKPPDVSLGNLLSSGTNSVNSLPWTFWFPALVLVFLTVSMALIADGLRDALDPNSAAGGRA